MTVRGLVLAALMMCAVAPAHAANRPLHLELQGARGVNVELVRQDVANVLSRSFELVDANHAGSHRAVVLLRGTRAYVRVLDPTGARVGTRRIAEDELGRRPAGNWNEGARRALALAVADVVQTLLAGPVRTPSTRARGKKVDVQLTQLDVARGEEDILRLELEGALPALAGCLDRLKDTRRAQSVTVRGAWDAAGLCQGLHLEGFEEEPAVQQCLTLSGPALNVAGDGERSASAALTLRVEPAR